MLFFKKKKIVLTKQELDRVLAVLSLEKDLRYSNMKPTHVPTAKISKILVSRNM